MQNNERSIFKKGSTTFFMSSLFFPKDIRQDVFDLYSFVRVADDYVDQVPADTEGFYRLRHMWEDAIINPGFDVARSESDSTDLQVVKNMLRVARKHHFDLTWVDSFMDSMQSDLTVKEYKTIDDTLWYIHGSAEVVGLMMANIMGLVPEAAQAAKMQGRAMQIINFIRDINEDIDLNRSYFPVEDFEQFNLKDLTLDSAIKHPTEFNNFIQFQIDRYDGWQAQAYEGYKFIPKRLRTPLQTATDMYNWTAQEIQKEPMVIFEKKIKPSKFRVVRRALINSM